MKLSKSHFYQCEFQNCSRSSDLKKTWSLINSLIGKNNKSNINEIIVNSNTISDPKIIAESFNDYFVNIGPKLAFEANKSTGLDKIPAKILKLASDIIAPSLTFIFNLSLATEIYVDDWKRARVTPIYKYEDKKKCENYRPISILPIIRKVFGREVFRQLYHYLYENSLLSRYQSGFRPKHSTLSELIQMCDEWLQNMDNGNLNCVVFLDVRKALTQ
jgi:hypothetical protein